MGVGVSSVAIGALIAWLSQDWLAGGIGATMVLITYVGIVVGRSSRINDEVAQRTRELNEANAQLQAEIEQRSRMEQALRESEALYHSLVDYLPLCIFRKNRDGRYVFVNRRYCEVFQKTEDDIMGKSAMDIFDEPLARKYVADDQRVMDSGSVFHDIEEHRLKDGKKRYVEIFKAPVYSHSGDLIGVQGAMWDVTERKQAEEALDKAHHDLEHRVQERTEELVQANRNLQLENEERKRAEEARTASEGRLRQVIDLVPHMIFAKDREGRFILANEALAHQFGTTVKTITGTLESTLHPPSAEFDAMVADDHAVMDSGKPKVIPEESFVGPDGNIRVLQTMKIPYTIPDSGDLGVLGVAVDITDQKNIERKLREHQEKLEDLVAARTRELEAANQQLTGEIADRVKAEEDLKKAFVALERSNTELQQFAYIASHDLQEPLRMIGSYCQLLGRHYQGRLDERGSTWLAYAVDGAKRMQALIQDLLNYARVDSRGRKFTDVDCNNVVQQALDNLKISITDSGAQISCDSLPTVIGDNVQLTQLFQNLVGNALKFQSRVTPKINIKAELVDGDWMFSVEDNGIGFEPDYKERIFEIFKRLHHRHKYPGTGIGLAVCRRIIHRHGGRIWAESMPNRGSVFYFTIPTESSNLLPAQQENNR